MTGVQTCALPISDSVNDDTLRFKKAISDGYQHILLPQGNLFVSELEITAAINLVGYGGIGCGREVKR